jgi:archaemetzincin
MRTPEAAACEALRVVALGAWQDALDTRLAERLSRALQLPCALERWSPPEVQASLPGREQCDARSLLAPLAGRARGPHELVLGVTRRDLALPVFSFVFGLAQAGGSAAVVSAARLDPAFYGLPSDPPRLLARTLGVALHELGHLEGLVHCPAGSCLMRFAGTVDKADARGLAFCLDCRRRLPAWLAGGHGAARLSAE